MLKRVTLAAVLPLSILVGCSSGTLHRDAGEQIIALERSALDKWARGDTSGYVDIGANDVTWFDFTEGEQLRLDGLEALRTYLEPFATQIPPHTYEIVNPKAQVYGDSAVLTFHWRAIMTDGNPLPEWKATSVYHWEDGQWRQVHAHWSMVQGE